MEHRCDHDHAPHLPISDSKLSWAVGMTVAFVVAEATAGLFSHSLALLSDAGHNLTDAAALCFSWYAVRVARRHPHAGMTFGYHRVGVLAALVNGLSLVLIAVLILWQAAGRLAHPEPAVAWPMVVVAAVAIVMNLLIGAWLHAASQHDLNLRSARLHMLGDALSAAGVVVAGVVIAVTGSTWVDPAVSVLIGLLILLGCRRVLVESVGVLLEATPVGVDMAALQGNILRTPGVLAVHDLHVWTVGPGVIAASFHLVVAEQSIRGGHAVAQAVGTELKSHHRINHTTVQIETEGDCDDALFGWIDPGHQHLGHSH